MVCSLKKDQFANVAFIVKGQGHIYLASEIGRTEVVYTMVAVQGLDELKSVKTCEDLSVHFCQKVTWFCNRFKEIH